MSQKSIISIYDAAFSDNKWARALDVCANDMGAKGAMLYQFPYDQNVQFLLNETSSVFLDYEDDLNEYNRLLENGEGTGYDQEGLGHVHTIPFNGVVTDEDIWTLDENYFARPEVEIGMRAGFCRRGFVNLSTDPTVMAGLIFLYDQEHLTAIPGQIRRLGPVLAPHITKAAELFRLNHKLRAKYNAALSVLDRISTGVVVLSENCELIVENEAAFRLLDEQEALVRKDGKLAAKDEDANNFLKAMAAEVGATAHGEMNNSGSFVQIPRPGTKESLVVVLSPLRDSEMEIEKGLAGVFATIIDPLQSFDIQTDLIAAVYQLTNAESRVATLLLTGLSNSEISDRLGVSPETIKSQVSSILTKSGCASRVAFIWRVFQLAPPIR